VVLEPAEEYHDLASLVREKARKNGNRPALRFAGRDISYADLDRETDVAARRLAAAGLREGSKVALSLFNCPEFLFLWLGASKLGAVAVPLNTALKGEILRYELDDSQASAIVVDGRLLETLAPALKQVPIEHVWTVGEPGGSFGLDPRIASWGSLAGVEIAPHIPAPWDPAAILYTSGTTGPPKGAVIPHEKYSITPREIAARSRLRPDSVLFTALPLFHCNAQEMTTLVALQNDLVAAYDERFRARSYWETAAAFGATHVSLLISMINVLYKQPSNDSDRSHTVRTALTAGTSRDIWRPFEERFGLTIIELYGMTECGCTTLMNPPDRIRVGSVGTPLGFVEAQVVDDQDAPVPDGSRGELVVRPRSPYSMFLEYHRKPEQTVSAWRNLWFHTGDYVTRDAEGYYYFVDRKKDIIRRRGENLAPYDVETVVNQHPAVFESVVIGVPSPLGEEDVKAFVLLRPGCELLPEELFRFCADRLPFFMVPRYLEFVDEIPKTANQKAQRYLLRQRPAGQQHDREAMGLRIRPPAANR
jgi:carnitine-CoA ligase